MKSLEFLILTLMLSVTTCHSPVAPIPSPSPESRTVKLTPIPAILFEEKDRLLEVHTSSIGSSYNLKQAQFLDANNGWVVGRQGLYRTSDAGKEWKSLNPNIPPDSYITSFFFADANNGWLTVINQLENQKYGRGLYSTIMVTHDGGETWSEQAVFRDEVTLNHLNFVNLTKGIAVGGKSINRDQPYIEMFVVSTADAGRTWKDISERVKPAIQTPYVIGNDSGIQTRWVSGQISLLTSGSRVIASDNGGETWKPIVHFTDAHPEELLSRTGYYRLLFDTKGRLRLLAGARGDEGYRGDLIVSDEHNSWQSHTLIRVPLLDAVFLAENELLACGQELRRDKKTNAPLPALGIIIHSQDNGKSWTPVYRTRADETLIYLTRVNETDFYAVSDIGNFIKFTMK